MQMSTTCPGGRGILFVSFVFFLLSLSLCLYFSPFGFPGRFQFFFGHDSSGFLSRSILRRVSSFFCAARFGHFFASFSRR